MGHPQFMRRGRANRRPRPACAFSLVEVLVVIAVIALLIALLFPALARARRAALVLACPIAYVGEDGALYLTNVSGTAEFMVSRPGWRVQSRDGLRSPVAWSPSGSRLAFQAQDRNTGAAAPVFMDVSSGRTWTGERGFGGWVDSDTYLSVGAWGHWTYRVGSGQPVQELKMTQGRHYDTFSPLPPGSDGVFVASIHGNNVVPYIGLVGKDYMPRRPLHSWKSDWGAHVHLTPKVDSTGQWVAWSRDRRVWVKPVRAHPLDDASRVPLPYAEAEFCDWTEDGQLLVNGYAPGGVGELAVVSIDGRQVKRLSTTVRPAAGQVAAYRKYWHQ